ncbi:MAG TPA: crosslink repair DNA glycosylase YcaQ family protein, partial [Anaerolineales bacterium]|nr:crosslink repair DNA glycosylase YcaQ family protein [Anaerolineales bacterium]
RFAAAYGPITANDFAKWFWITPAQAQALIDTNADALMRVSVAGGYAWLPTGSPEPASQQQRESVRLVPQYDCYVLGSHPRESIVPGEARQRIATHGRGRFEGAVGLPVLLVNGIVSGIWERRERAAEVVL